jgi:hypothetical protein
MVHPVSVQHNTYILKFTQLHISAMLSYPYAVCSYEACPEISSHFQYLKNRSCGLDVTWQSVRGGLTVHP